MLFSADDKILYDYGKERDHMYYYKRVNGDNIELCYTDLRNPDFKTPEIIQAGRGDLQPENFTVLKDHIYYSISRNGISSSLWEFVKGASSKEISIPFASGSIEFMYRSPYENDLWISLVGWTSNYSDYYYENHGSFKKVKLGEWPSYPEFSNVISEVIEVKSHDGTKIPLTIIRRSDHKLDKNTKGIITAYGAYGASESPWFHSPIIDFVNNGNIYATAHVRGGGEKGPAWHKAGLKSSKSNSWKDLNACSEFLINNEYVQAKKLGLNVNSAGGVTGGMAINERPDLYGAFVGFLPSLNLSRTEYLEDFDDSDNAYEFGSLKNKEEYKYLLGMDPVFNLSEKNQYPSTLMIIGFKDYLIPPSSAGKYIAWLQNNQKNKKPYLLDIKFDAEHDTDWVEDFAKMLFFMEKELDQNN